MRIESRRADSALKEPLLITPSTMTDITPRVNGARMNDYIGRPVRLICKVTKVPVSFFPDSFGPHS